MKNDLEMIRKTQVMDLF